MTARQRTIIVIAKKRNVSAEALTDGDVVLWISGAGVVVNTIRQTRELLREREPAARAALTEARS